MYIEKLKGERKIVVGVQIDKKEVGELIEKYGEEKFETETKSGLEAAMTLNNG